MMINIEDTHVVLSKETPHLRIIGRGIEHNIHPISNMKKSLMDMGIKYNLLNLNEVNDIEFEDRMDSFLNTLKDSLVDSKIQKFKTYIDRDPELFILEGLERKGRGEYNPNQENEEDMVDLNKREVDIENWHKIINHCQEKLNKLVEVAECANIFIVVITKELTLSEELENMFDTRLSFLNENKINVEVSGSKHEYINEAVLTELKELELRSDSQICPIKLGLSLESKGIYKDPYTMVTRAMNYLINKSYIKDMKGGKYTVIVDSILW